jgi:hypothetical protein
MTTEQENQFTHIHLGTGNVGVYSGSLNGVHALIFGKNGSGIIGEKLEGDRYMNDNEVLATITFGNRESLEVVLTHLNAIRDRFMKEPCRD